MWNSALRSLPRRSLSDRLADDLVLPVRVLLRLPSVHFDPPFYSRQAPAAWPDAGSLPNLAWMYTSASTREFGCA